MGSDYDGPDIPYPLPEKREKEKALMGIYDSESPDINCEKVEFTNPFRVYVPPDSSTISPKQEGEALKYDNNKTDWAILPLGAVEEIIKVMKFGEVKYARGNFASSTGLSYTRLLNALVRHTFSFMRGEDLDPESGLHHMAHAGCCVLFILHYIVNPGKYTSNDDRGSNILP